MVDQRGRDDPPIFYIPTQLAGYKYHAVLTEPVAHTFNSLLDLADDHQPEKRTADGEFSRLRPRGLYGFQTVLERDKFCRLMNGLADMTEAPICFPVTIPNIHMDEPLVTTIRYQQQPATGSVANKED